MRYRDEGVPLLVIAGREYGSGSSRDWAAKGTTLLGIRAVIAESYERIHRSNLVGMGVLPLQFLPGESAASLGLTGREAYTIHGLAEIGPRQQVTVAVRSDAPTAASGRSGRSRASTARSRSSTCARAGSCRRSCGASPGTERRPRPERRAPRRNGAKPPGDPGASLIRTLVGAGRRPRPREGAIKPSDGATARGVTPVRTEVFAERFSRPGGSPAGRRTRPPAPAARG